MDMITGNTGIPIALLISAASLIIAFVNGRSKSTEQNTDLKEWLSGELGEIKAEQKVIRNILIGNGKIGLCEQVRAIENKLTEIESKAS